MTHIPITNKIAGLTEGHGTRAVGRVRACHLVFFSALGPIPSALLLLGLACAGCSDTAPGFITLTLGNQPIQMELAVTSRQIERGMMGRTSLADDKGMLFIFRDDKVRHFWMKNCLIPLDVVYINQQGRIVSIMTMKVPQADEADDPPSYSSRWPVSFAVELRAGRAAELGIKEGDKVDWPLDRLRQLSRAED